MVQEPGHGINFKTALFETALLRPFRHVGLDGEAALFINGLGFIVHANVVYNE